MYVSTTPRTRDDGKKIHLDEEDALTYIVTLIKRTEGWKRSWSGNGGAALWSLVMSTREKTPALCTLVPYEMYR